MAKFFGARGLSKSTGRLLQAIKRAIQNVRWRGCQYFRSTAAEIVGCIQRQLSRYAIFSLER